MLNKLTISGVLTPCFLAASLLAGCAAPTSDVGAEQSELRNGIEVLYIDYDARSEAFTVGIELDRTVLDAPDARYMVAQLFYAPNGAGVSPFAPPRGAGVSPFSATPIRRIVFSPVGRAHLFAELVVEGPRPRSIEDVVARVSANPTPYP